MALTIVKALISAVTAASCEFGRSLTVQPAACVGPYFLTAGKYRSPQCTSGLTHLATFADEYLSCRAKVTSRRVQELQPLFLSMHRF